MDVRYINPFVEALQKVFKTMLGLDLLISKPTLKSKDAPTSDVSAIIGFSGTAFGTVSLCFSKQIAVKIASKFAGEELTIYEPEMLADALGELTNMVAGQAKAHLPASSIAISLPRVVLGENHQILGSLTTPVLLLPCDSPLGRFSTEITMMVKKFSPFAVEVSMAGSSAKKQ